jgi:hypothetical protein
MHDHVNLQVQRLSVLFSLCAHGHACMRACMPALMWVASLPHIPPWAPCDALRLHFPHLPADVRRAHRLLAGDDPHSCSPAQSRFPGLVSISIWDSSSFSKYQNALVVFHGSDKKLLAEYWEGVFEEPMRFSPFGNRPSSVKCFYRTGEVLCNMTYSCYLQFSIIYTEQYCLSSHSPFPCSHTQPVYPKAAAGQNDFSPQKGNNSMGDAFLSF